jgi:hypothetical protein
MKITAIELTEDEISEIVNYLTSKFNTEDKKQTIQFDHVLHLTNGESITFDTESILELYTEYPEKDENNQTAISYRSVPEFRITFFYDGEEIKVNTNEIYYSICKFYEI